jgi:DNA-binding transcriptional LysR family regulator
VDLVQLRVFVTVAEELHFGRAAERLHLVPSAVSQHVARLERGLGGRLLDRTSRRVALTAAGRTLLREARLVLDAARQAEDETRLVTRAAKGALSVACPPSVRDAVALPAVLAYECGRAGAAGPAGSAASASTGTGVDVDLRELPSREVSRRVTSGEVDAGFAWLPEVPPTLTSVTVLERPLLAVLPDHHALRTKDVVAPGDLAGSPFLVGRRRDNPPLHDLVLATLGAAGPPGSPPPTTRQVDSLATMAALVLAGRGIGVTVAGAAAVAACGVPAVPLDAPRVPLSLIWCRDNANPALAAFLDTALPAAEGPDCVPEAGISGPRNAISGVGTATARLSR